MYKSQLRNLVTAMQRGLPACLLPWKAEYGASNCVRAALKDSHAGKHWQATQSRYASRQAPKS